LVAIQTFRCPPGPKNSLPIYSTTDRFRTHQEREEGLRIRFCWGVKLGKRIPNINMTGRAPDLYKKKSKGGP